jgi:hypothetical protein
MKPVCQGIAGANRGSQPTQIRSDLPRRPRNVIADGRLSARLSQTGPDTGFVPGGQGVAGSNPAVPTGRQVFSNTPMPPPEPTKEPFHREMTLPEAHAHHAPRPPTRAFVNTAEPAKPGSQGVKDRRATPDPAQRPRQLRTPGHHPPAHRLTASQTRTGPQKLWDAGRPERTRQARPRHLRRDAYRHEISPRTNRHDSCQRHGKRLAVMKCASCRFGAPSCSLLLPALDAPIGQFCAHVGIAGV